MKSNRINFHFLLGILIACLIVFEYFGLAKVFYQVLAIGLQPAQKFTTKLVQKIEWPLATAKKSFNSARKVQMLEERYSEALAQLTDLKKLESENQQLKALLQNSDREDRTVIVTAPIVSQAGPTLGVGSQDGVVAGDLVFVSRTLIGRVREVYLSYCEIDLIHQADFQPVVAQSSEGYKGLIKGDGKRVIFTEVLPEQNPAPESRLETVGQIGIESGYFVGQIGRLISNSSATVKTYQVTQYVDFYQAPLVEIYK